MYHLWWMEPGLEVVAGWGVEESVFNPNVDTKPTILLPEISGVLKTVVGLKLM